MRRPPLFLILVTLFFSTYKTASCQVRVGVRASLNIASVKFDNSDLDPVARFGGGFSSEIDVGDRLFLRPELIYAIKGWKSPYTAMNLHYLNLPILLGYKPTSRLSLLGGVEFGCLLDWVSKPKSSFVYNYEQMDYGISLGAAYKLVDKLNVELRYTYGFDTLLKWTVPDNSSLPTTENRDGSNRVLQLSVLYFFN